MGESQRTSRANTVGSARPKWSANLQQASVSPERQDRKLLRDSKGNRERGGWRERTAWKVGKMQLSPHPLMGFLPRPHVALCSPPEVKRFTCWENWTRECVPDHMTATSCDIYLYIFVFIAADYKCWTDEPYIFFHHMVMNTNILRFEIFI